mgnify:CR=1 FL=1
MLSPSEIERAEPTGSLAGGAAAAMQRLRVSANVRLAAQPAGDRTRLAELAENHGYRIKFPDGAGFEAVLVNTGGGLLGGDRLDLAIEAREGATMTVTTQAAEKVYRALGQASEVSARLTLGAAARLDWIPQETILFSGARLARRFDAEMAADATLLMAETVVFGRIAHGETMGAGLFRDRWRIRRAGKLVFADDVALDGPMADLLDRPAVAGGARALASLLLVGPDAEARLEGARDLMAADGVAAGASAWGGMLVARLMAADPMRLRMAMERVLCGLRGAPLPRSW